jgi:hypothetical protein
MMDYWLGIRTVGWMVLIFFGMVAVWYIYHVLRPIVGHYLHFHITRFLGWREYPRDEER